MSNIIEIQQRSSTFQFLRNQTFKHKHFELIMKLTFYEYNNSIYFDKYHYVNPLIMVVCRNS